MKNAVETFTKHLKQNGLRLTQERMDLFKLILATKEHFTPEDLLKRIKSKKIPVSRATVYRLIPVLIQADIIQQSLLSEGQSKFEVTWNRAHHDHLICSQCNKVIEFHHNTIELLQREIASKYGFVLDHHVMELVGRCESCQAKIKKH